MSLAVDLSQPYYTGTPIAAEVPGKFPVALNGRPYLIDRESSQHRHKSIRSMKAQQDNSNEPGEQTLNPEGLWRRSQSTWHKGAGQAHLDRDGSDRARFRSSKGVDPWSMWELSLLNDTTSKRASAESNLQLAVVGSYLYAVDGSEVYRTQSLSGAPVWTAVGIQAGEGAQSVKAIATDGYSVFAALGSNGIHVTTRGASMSSHYSALSCTLVAYIKGRLMAANGNAIYNVIASGAAPAALFTHPNTDFTWVGFAAGQAAIYAAGYSGDKSLVYRTAVKADGTALDVPVVAGELPDGEIIRSIAGYLGFVLIGTDKGLRFAVADAAGNLTLGALIETAAAVRAFEGQDRFAWFGWTNYDAGSTGLGRLDLSVLNDTAPAYASDLMAATQGAVTSIATFDGRRAFAVSGVGVFAESPDKAASGHVDSGYVSYNLPDDKVALYVDVRHRPLEGSYSASVAADDGPMTVAGSHGAAASTSELFPVPQLRGERFEVRNTLSRDELNSAAGPVITRWTLMANPTAGAEVAITVPLLLHELLDVADGTESCDVAFELEHIRHLRSTREPVVYQEGDRRWTVIVEDFEFAPFNLTHDGLAFNGTCVVSLKSV